MGRAIVASRTGAIPELIRDSESGLLVEPGSPEQLERGLLRLLRDPDERARLGDGARKRSAELSPERELRAWSDVYRHLFASGPHANWEATVAEVGERELPS